MAKFGKRTTAARPTLKGTEGKSTENLRVKGVVVRTNKYGLFVVNAEGKQFGFTLDKVRRYSGQNPSKVGLNVGDQVSLNVQDDRVQTADTKVLAADAFH
jgi:polyribonucleotide nucleotidyltransferase